MRASGRQSFRLTRWENAVAVDFRLDWPLANRLSPITRWSNVSASSVGLSIAISFHGENGRVVKEKSGRIREQLVLATLLRLSV